MYNHYNYVSRVPQNKVIQTGLFLLNMDMMTALVNEMSFVATLCSGLLMCLIWGTTRFNSECHNMLFKIGFIKWTTTLKHKWREKHNVTHHQHNIDKPLVIFIN